MKHKVLIADSSPAFGEGIAQLIRRSPHFILSGIALTENETLQCFNQQTPDVLIIDVNLPDRGGISLIRTIRQQQLAPQIILISDQIKHENFQEGLLLGVKSYLLKRSSLDEIERCLQSISSTDLFLCKRCEVSSDSSQAFQVPLNKTLAQLSHTEAKVLALIARQKTTKEIAEIVCRSEKTIENHRGNICRKLNLSGRNGLLRYALAHSQLFIDTLWRSLIAYYPLMFSLLFVKNEGQPLCIPLFTSTTFEYE